MNRTHRHARRFAELGISVFPVRNKLPLAGSHAELDGTCEVAKIDEWWERDRGLGVAVALRMTRLFVVDVDARNGGAEALEDLPGPMPKTLITITGSGWPSAHYWFQRTPALEGLHLKALGVGMDLKGLPYGYVCAPPTRGSKQEYAFDGGWTDPAMPPAWLEERLLELGSHRGPGGRSYPAPLDIGLDSFPLGRAAKNGNAVLFQAGPGKWAVVCPNWQAHTREKGTKRRGDSSTVLFAPGPGRRDGRLFCSHGHCQGVDLRRICLE